MFNIDIRIFFMYLAQFIVTVLAFSRGYRTVAFVLGIILALFNSMLWEELSATKE